MHPVGTEVNSSFFCVYFLKDGALKGHQIDNVYFTEFIDSSSSILMRKDTFYALIAIHLDAYSLDCEIKVSY